VQAASIPWHLKTLDAPPLKTVCIAKNRENISRRSRNRQAGAPGPAQNFAMGWANRSRNVNKEYAYAEIETSVMVLAVLYALALIGLIAWLA
jgi:hypothetical protein